VYLDLPKQTEPMEQVFGELLPFTSSPTGPMPTLDEWLTPTDTNDWEHEWIQEDDNGGKETLPSRPVPLPVPSAKCSADGSVRGIDVSTQQFCPGGHESRRSLLRRLEE